MAKKKIVDSVKSKSIPEIVKHRNWLKADLMKMRMKNTMKTLKDTSSISKTKYEIAVCNTVLTSKIKENYGDNMK